MRETKFRGKRKDNGEWIHGSLVILPISEVPLITECQFDYTGRMIHFDVDPDTVGQFTGLHDKEGWEIYEGDIVTTDLQRPYNVVVYRDGSFMYNCNDGGDDYYDIMVPILKEPQTQDKYCKVIGNIHDNPELLQGGSTDE